MGVEEKTQSHDPSAHAVDPREQFIPIVPRVPRGSAVLGPEDQAKATEVDPKISPSAIVTHVNHQET